ncbi:MAG: hypothetical protein IH944_05435 [Armatimonadetes bacterium]|nr:hypothetical protein [Armatimonadota bacterium]
MGKKRRVWWVAGGVGLVVLFTFTMLAMHVNSADARMDATLEDIALRYSLDVEHTGETFRSGSTSFVRTWESSELTAADMEQILRTIDAACKNCTADPSDREFGEAGAVFFQPGDEYDQTFLIIVADGRVAYDVWGGTLTRGIMVVRINRPFWVRVTDWWPW